MTDLFDQTPLRQNPHRWCLSRAGFVNVWHYYENTFDISGGRLILRSTNGSGKSRALEMLLPFLLAWLPLDGQLRHGHAVFKAGG